MRDYAKQVDTIRQCVKSEKFCAECEYAKFGTGSRCKEAMANDAADAIEELQAERDRYKEAFEQENSARITAMEVALRRWISVEERLPDKNYAVIGYCVGNGCIFTVYHDGEKWRHFSQRTDPVFYPVTHWMPLPSVPKEVRDEV